MDNWDKTFPKSDKVEHKKVKFNNRFGITLAADMYTPKSAEGRRAFTPATLSPYLPRSSTGTAQRMIHGSATSLSKSPASTARPNGFRGVLTQLRIR